MDAQKFLAEFGHIANAPGGVARLREMVLALAVSGRLIEQSEVNESLAADSLKKLEQELADYKAANGYRRTSGGRDAASTLLVPAPSGWVKARLGQIGVLIRGVTYNKAVARASGGQGMTGLLRANNIGANISFDDLVYVPSDLVDKEQILCAGDVLISMSSGSKGLVGKAAMVLEDTEFGFGAFCGAFRPMPSLRCEFIRVVMQSPQYRDYVSDQGKGIGINNLTKGHIENYELFFPSPEEQSRIVAKVDELMALCDKLETQQQARRKLQNSLRQSILQAVASATSPHELQTTWTCLADNFGRLFHAPEDVDELVAELKNMAVRGLLSLPSTSVSPVDAVVADCDNLRDQYITSGLMRRQKLISIADSDVVYPEHWAVAPFDKVAVVIGGVTKGRDLRGRDVVTCPYLAVANVQRGFFKLTNLKTIQIGKEELDKYLVQEGDLLITEGGDWDKVGRTAIWRGGIDNCLHQNHVFKARVPSLSLLNEWVELVFNSGLGRDYFAGASKQTTNLASINMTQLRSFPMPIPPLDEQRAILAKLNALTVKAKFWHQQLEKKQHLAELLADATLASFTGITTEPEEEPMKAPQTELVAPLRLGTAPDIKAQAPLATILARHHGEMEAKDLWQRFGGEIDAFYQQLKTEVAHGWIVEPEPARVELKD
ncbi:restriction endonuclease subunit S [Dechloromonas sp. ZY10]|uniref:restriction endonuclease subunit S n=1 Tax=Dechloromonas aquae TaxID=2664436 RepID=UPI0035287656